jgi:hypothetical protein
VVGGPVEPGVEADTTSGANCSFRASASFTLPGTSAAVGAGTVTYSYVRFLDATTFAQRKAAWEAQRRFSPNISGLGDQAFVVGGPHFQEVLVARDHYRLAFDVEVGLGGALEPELELARAIVPRV